MNIKDAFPPTPRHTGAFTSKPSIEAETARRGIKLIGRGADRCGPCPACGGRDRFSINIRKQVWNCRGCARGGDVIDLVRHLDAVDFKTAAASLAGDAARIAARPTIAAEARPAIVNNENGGRALRLWNEAVPIAGTLAAVYLRRRCLEPPPDDEALRFHPACPFGGVAIPCMIALFRDIATNEPRAIHRTALKAGGIKVDRKALGPVAGCAIKLSADENVEQGLAIGEGIETVLAGMQRGFLPAWATGFSGAIATFPVLPGIDALTIMVDNDALRDGRQAGPDAAVECAKRWVAAGREVWWEVPPRGCDMATLASEVICG